MALMHLVAGVYRAVDFASPVHALVNCGHGCGVEKLKETLKIDRQNMLSLVAHQLQHYEFATPVTIYFSIIM
jgi:hypothetical protein